MAKSVKPRQQNSSNGQRTTVDNASLAEMVEHGKDGPPAPADEEITTLPPEEETPSRKKPAQRKDLFITEEDEDFSDEIPGLDAVPVHQPSSEIVFRTRPGPQWRAEAMIVDFRQENPDYPSLRRGKYLVLGPMRKAFKAYGRKVLLVTCVTSTGQVFLWDVKVTEGFGDSWFKSDLNIVKIAHTEWVRFLKNSGGNAHSHRVSKKAYGDPKWPSEEVAADIYDLALLAFSEERMVEDATHPLCDFFEIEG
jgi:hypothetical protein